jgi:hypothetical protein
VTAVFLALYVIAWLAIGALIVTVVRAMFEGVTVRVKDVGPLDPSPEDFQAKCHEIEAILAIVTPKPAPAFHPADVFGEYL